MMPILTRVTKRVSRIIANRKGPAISTVLLNWNRLHLLRLTLESYLATVSVPFELIVVDNGSSDGSREFIEQVRARNSCHAAICLDENLGGEAINQGARLARGRYLHISENDIEYLPGWDSEILSKFEAFPELGQISLFAAEPEDSRGEIWEKHPARPVRRGKHTIYLADHNVGTTCVCQREFWDKGLRWRTYPFQIESGSKIKMPDDGAVSAFIKQQGYWVAWNDRYVGVNWGHNVEEWKRDLEYYLDDYKSKWWLGVEGMRRRLSEHGYDLVVDQGKYRIAKLESDSPFKSASK